MVFRLAHRVAIAVALLVAFAALVVSTSAAARACLVPGMIVNDIRPPGLERPQPALSASGGQVQKRLRSP